MLGLAPIASAPLAAIILRDPFIAAAGAYALSGQSVGLSIGRKVTAAVGSYAVSGIAVNLKSTAEPTGGALLAFGAIASYPMASVQSTITVYSLNIVAGAYTYSGQSVGLQFGHKITADAGHYLISNNAVALSVRMPVVAGAYSVSGQDVSLRATRRLTIAAGSYSLSGQATILRFGHKVPAALGQYTLSGKDVELIAPRKIYPDAGVYLVTGRVVRIVAARKLYPFVGQYVLTGKSLEFVFGFDLKNGKYIRLEGFHEDTIEMVGVFKSEQRLGGPKE